MFILHLRRGPSLASGRSQRWRVKLRERSCRTSTGQTLDVFLLILNDFEVNKIVRTHGAGRGITKKQEEKKMGIKIQVQNQESYPLSLLLESDVYTLGIGYAGLAWEIARFARNVPCFYGNGAATSKATLRRTDSV